MPSTDLEGYQKLCDSLQFLGIDVLEGRDLHQILKDMHDVIKSESVLQGI